MSYRVEEPIGGYLVGTMMSPPLLINVIKTFTDAEHHISRLKELTNATDEVIAGWLDITVKTFRSYRNNPGVVLKAAMKEHLIMLESLAVHGERVLGSAAAFGQWLHTDNFFFDNKKPADFLNTNSGVRLVDDRLTGMEYGDNA